MKYLINALFMSLVTILISACGGEGSTETTASTTASSTLSLSASTLQYSSNDTLITGSITIANSGTSDANLSSMVASVSGCTIASQTIGSGTVTVSGSSSAVVTVNLTFSAACSAATATISGTQTTSSASISFSLLADIAIAATPVSGITSDITTLIADSATQSITLTLNDEPRTIKLLAFNANNVPVNSGTIGVRYPNEVLNGTDIGTLNPIGEVEVSEGVAEFSYTGPSNIVNLVNSGISSTTFTFYDLNNAARYVDVTINYSPDTTTPPPILTDFTISLENAGGLPTTDLDTESIFTIIIKDKNGNPVDDAQVTDLNITTLSPALIKLLDVNNSNATATTLNFNKNNVSLPLQTYTISGMAPMEFSASILDDYNNSISVSQVIPITIFSGAPTAISMHVATVNWDTTASMFTETIVVFLSDKYSNPVNTQPSIYAGALAGYQTAAGSGVGNDYLVKDAAEATITQSGTGAQLSLATTPTLASIDIYNDILVTYGEGYSYHSSGKWEITAFDDTANTITVADAYNSTTPTTNLAYAVGNNIRQKNPNCSFGEELVINVDSQDGTYKVNTDGYAIVDIIYPPGMVGKTVFTYVNVLGLVNSLGETMRLGEAYKRTLTGNGIELRNSTAFAVAAGSTDTSPSYSIILSDVGGGIFYYSSGNFNVSYDATVGIDPASTTITKTNAYTACNQSFTITATATADGTVTPSEVTISEEF